MTNFEKYRDEVLAIVNQNSSVAIVDGLPQGCVGTSCSDCELYSAGIGCGCKITQWLYADFQPFKKGERVIVEREDGVRLRRYFAEQKEDRISVFANGCDEWSSGGSTASYPAECVKAYKEGEDAE